MDLPEKDVLPESSPDNSEVVKTPEPVVPAKEDEPALPTADPTKPPKGYVPYEALNEERRMRKEVEQKLAELESSSVHSESDDVVYSDEGIAIKKQFESRLSKIEEELQVEKVKAQFPQIADKLEDFNEFRKEYPRHKLENVAKIFLVEHDLLGQKPERKGLETPTAGQRTPQKSGYSADDIKRLRENEPRRFAKMIRDGTIDPEDIEG